MLRLIAPNDLQTNIDTSPITKREMESGKKLKSVSATRGGTVNVNLKAASKLNKPVLNTPGRNSTVMKKLKKIKKSVLYVNAR